MGRIKHLLLLSLCVVLPMACQQSQDSTPSQAHTQNEAESLEQLAQCLTAQGVIMYGSITCSACRSQRKVFGDAFHAIQEIECNPHITPNQTERCLNREIKKTPTWILEKDGSAIKRLEEFQLPEQLAEFFGCR